MTKLNHGTILKFSPDGFLIFAVVFFASRGFEFYWYAKLGNHIKELTIILYVANLFCH